VPLPATLIARNKPSSKSAQKAKIVRQRSQHIKAVTAVFNNMHTLYTALLQQHREVI